MAKFKETIFAEMEKGPSKDLVAEMERFCARNKLDLMETFFDEGEHKKKVWDAWNSDEEFGKWLLDRLTKGNRKGRSWFYPDQKRAELVRNSKEVVAQSFIHFRDSSANGGYFDYRVIDRANKIVEPLANDQDRLRDIATTLAPIIAEDGYEITMAEAKTVFELATVHGRTITGKPTICAQPDDEGYCLHRITVLPLEEQVDDLPALAAIAPDAAGFLSRTNDPEALAAWIYGVASNRYVGRQVLWLYGKGSDGKSTFFKAFSSIFGITAGAVDWNALKHSASFAGSLFVGKRFCYVPDNNNPELLSTGLFKSLADPGSDPVVINHKYGKMYSAELEAHTAVLSNYEPNIRDEASLLTRCLFLTVEPRDMSEAADKSITERFRAQLPAVLAFGRGCYARRCQNNTEIELNAAAMDRIAARMADGEEEWETVFAEFFELSDGTDTAATDVFTILKEDARLNNHQIGEFRKWLETRHGVTVGQKRVDGERMPRAYAGLALRGAATVERTVLDD